MMIPVKIRKGIQRDQNVGPDEASADAYIQRVRARDSDLWVIEIEDRDARHFLTEPVEKLS